MDFFPKTKWRERHFKNGLLDGVETFWREDGVKSVEQHYKNGEKDGLETYWYTISDRYYPTDGRKCKQGNKKSTQYYKDGLLHGKKTTWDEDGKKTSEVNFVDGEVEK
jgi:antitoxin component YwqK of YwqJK toxin-antitoxin module